MQPVQKYNNNTTNITKTTKKSVEHMENTTETPLPCLSTSVSEATGQEELCICPGFENGNKNQSTGQTTLKHSKPGMLSWAGIGKIKYWCQ